MGKRGGRLGSERWHFAVFARSVGAKDERNEDHVGYITASDTVAGWVIDGATPIGTRGNIFECTGDDVRWFVGEIDRQLRQHSASALDPAVFFRTMIQSVYQTYTNRLRDPDAVPLHDYPLAAVAWVRVRVCSRAVQVEYFCLGDCPLFICCVGREEVAIVDNGEQERLVRQKLAALGLSAPNGREVAAILNGLRKRRTEQHSLPGIRAFVRNPQAVDNAHRGVVSLAEDFDVVVASDGLFRLVDMFARYSRQEFCASCVRANDQDRLFSELRALEESHDSAKKFPRLKVKDDASLLVVRAAKVG